MESLLQIKSAQGVSPLWLDALRNLLTRWARHMPPTWEEVTPDLVAAFLAGVPGARTRNNYLRAVRQLCTYAKARGWLRHDPLSGFALVRLPSREATAYTPDQVAAILGAAPARARVPLALVAFAGIRMAEVIRLSWSDLDLPRAQVHVSAAKAKTRARRLSPIPPNLAAWIGAPASGPLYPHKRRGIEWDLVLALRASGVRSIQNGLRHSFLSHALARDQNEGRVALAAGTSPAMLFKNYRDVVSPEAAQAYFSIVPGSSDR